MTSTAHSAQRTSPYLGLQSFTENDAEFFFGRERERDIVIAQIRASRLTVLYGPSGVGKTSLVRAGVLAELDARAALNKQRRGSPDFIPVFFNAWREQPSAALADAIAAAVTRLTGEPMPADSLLETIRTATTAADAKLFLLLDQFEDLSLYGSEANGGWAFSAAFPQLITDKSLRVNVLVSIREDALARLDQFRRVAPWLLDTRLRVQPLTAKAAERAITGPLERFNEQAADAEPVCIENDLISAVLRQVSIGRVGFERNGHAPGEWTDSGGAPIETPYLQLVMARVWEEEASHDPKVLRAVTLNEKLGGAQKIVSTHLDTVLDRLDPDQQRLAVTVFDRLVLPSGAKAAMRIPDLAEVSHRPVSDVEELVGSLEQGDRRVLRRVPPPPDRPDEPAVEIFHDVLGPGILTWRRHRLEEEARRQRTRARVYGTVAAVAVMLLIGGITVFIASQVARANHATRTAQSDSLARQGLADLGNGNANIGALLSMQAYRTAPTEQARDDLIYAQEDTQDMRAYLGGQGSQVQSLAYGPGTLAVGTADGTVALWNLATGQRERTLGGGALGFIEDVAFSPDGTTLAAATSTGKVMLWRVGTWMPVPGPHTDGRQLYAVAFGPTGLLAFGGVDKVVTLWNPRTGHTVRVLRGHTGAIDGLAFSHQSALVSSSADGTVRLWSPATGSNLHVFPGGGAHPAAAFNPGGDILAIAGANRALSFWALPSNRLLVTTPRQPSPVQAIAFSPDGSRMATGSDDGRVRLFLATGGAMGTLTTVLRGQTQKVVAIAFGPQGDMLASGSYDKSVVLWNAAPTLPPFILNAGSGIYSVALATGGHLIAAGVERGAVIWRDPAPTSLGQTLPLSHPGKVLAVAISPDAQVLAAADDSGSVSRWNAATGAPLPALSAGSALYGLAFTHPGTELLAAAYDGSVHRWALPSGSPLPSLRVDHNPLYAVAVSPDGSTIAAAGDDASIFIWDARTGALTHTLYGHTAPVEALAFNPSGNVLASGSQDDTVMLWNAQSWKQLGDPLRGHRDAVTSVAFSAHGRLLASGSRDGTAIAWDASTHLGRPLSDYTGDQIRAVAWRGRTLAIGTAAGFVEIFPSIATSTGATAIFSRLCHVAQRNLTRTEWRRFVPGQSYQRVCSQSP